MKPFSETAQFEQGRSTDSFYASGSVASVGETPGAFTRSLSNKAQIRLAFEVKNPIKMLPNSASIYYFSPTLGQWCLPAESIQDHVGPLDKFAVYTPSNPGSLFDEDAKGFDAYGRISASGSMTIQRKDDGYGVMQSISLLGTEALIDPRHKQKLIDLDSKDYPKSIQRAAEYDASERELFQINIDSPFLIEKAVFEFPATMGQTWFEDLTTVTRSSASIYYESTLSRFDRSYYDKGGPSLTLSLFCQKTYGSSSIRDLVLSGVITHENDSSNVVAGNNFVDEGNYYNVPCTTYGLKGPATTVFKNNGNTFTGSVTVKTQPAISNGWTYFEIRETKVRTDAGSSYVSSLGQFSNSLGNLFSSEYTTLGQFFETRHLYPCTINPFGRGMTGFAPSGGSIFGGEYVSPSYDSPFYLNPYYIQSERIRNDSVNQIIAKTEAAILSKHPFLNPNDEVAAISLLGPVTGFDSEKISPYLVNPGDKLLLAISKSRPAISASQHTVLDQNLTPNPSDGTWEDVGKSIVASIVPVTGSSDGHEVYLSTGSINITFYGSYVQGGNSYIP